MPSTLPRRRASVLGAIALAIVALVLFAPPAAAQTPETGGRGQILVVAEESTTVGPDEQLDNLWVTDGDAVIEGTVDNVVATRGDVTVRGQVNSTAVAFNGRVTVEAGATVNGDVYSTQTPDVSDEATVNGTATRIDPTGIASGVGRAISVFWWIAVTVSLAVVGLAIILLFPRALDRSWRTGREEVGPAALIGLVALFGLPLLAVVAAVTVVGIPIAIGVFLAYPLLAALGYIVTARLLGALMLRRDDQPALAFLAGFAVLQVVAAIPFLSVFAGLAAFYGVGAMLLAAWRAFRPEPAPTPPAQTTRPQMPSNV